MISFGVTLVIVYEFIKDQCHKNMLDAEQTSILLVGFNTQFDNTHNTSLQKHVATLWHCHKKSEMSLKRKMTKEAWLKSTKKVALPLSYYYLLLTS